MKWSASDVEYLQDTWGRLSQQSIANKLKRSIEAVKLKRARLGLDNWINSHEYITFNQLYKIIKHTDANTYLKDKWIRRGLQVHKVKFCKEKEILFVNLDEFFKWFEKNKHVIDISLTDNGDFGVEPKWLEEKRIADKKARPYTMQRPWKPEEDARLIELLNTFNYGYRDISVALKRTEGAIKRRMTDLKLKQRPIKADNHNKWSDFEIQKVKKLYLQGYKSCVIAEYVNRSALAINGLLERHNYFKEGEIMEEYINKKELPCEDIKNKKVHLTPKNYEVLQAICVKGIFTKKDLAKYFIVAQTTIVTHLNVLFRKFDVNSKAELIYKYHTNKLYEYEVSDLTGYKLQNRGIIF